MRKIALLNQKGGVGKTTSTINIAAGLRQLGKSVLVVDLDPQANMTYSLGIKAHELDKTIYNLLREETGSKEVRIDRGGLQVIPSSLDLSGADIELSQVHGREFLLKEALEDVSGVDFVLVDCPPSLGLLTVNALVFVNEIFIPVQTEFLALQGINKLRTTVQIVKRRLNKEVNITGVIATRYHTRKNVCKAVVDTIKQHFDEKVFKTLIRDNVALAECPGFGKTIFEYDSGSYGAQDYTSLSQEILERS